MTEPDYSLINRLKGGTKDGGSSTLLPPGGGGGTYDGMDRIAPLEARMANLEGEVREQFRWTIGTVLGSSLALLALMVALFLYTVGRLDTVQEQVSALPDQINRNLLELNRTLSDSITAARANQPPATPIIIQVPAQQPAPTPQQ